ncbi:MAG: CYTH domain-containing protein [Chloroflexales bacterium]|nr:CYTH domain-containing protein [Chloroflexales bacterium]
MEIEQKYRVDDDDVFPALLALRALGGYELRQEATPEQQHNTYFDTADQRMRAHRSGLRVRAVGGTRIATLKDEGSVVDGRATRGEWEASVGGDDPAAWPAGELRERVLAITGGAQLLPLLTIRTTRHNIAALSDSAIVAQISLDSATIAAGGREQPLRELEVELYGEGTLADIDAICTALLARFALHPESQSKLARGLALLEASFADT